MTPVVLQVHIQSGLGGNAIMCQYFFRDKTSSEEAFTALRDASAAYHNRANDRERIVTITHLSGQAAVDISSVAAISTSDDLGEGREALEAWEVAIAEVRATGRAAGNKISPLVDRSAKRQDAEEWLGPQDESDGAEGKRQSNSHA